MIVNGSDCACWSSNTASGQGAARRIQRKQQFSGQQESEGQLAGYICIPNDAAEKRATCSSQQCSSECGRGEH
jgi:hypothetical protein